MSGRRLVLAFLAFLAVFAAALVWFQLFAYYERQTGVGALRIAGQAVPVADYDGIDAATSPLKLRGCLRIDPAAVAALAPADRRHAAQRPLLVPLLLRPRPHPRPRRGRGEGLPHRATTSRPGFDLMLAVYPDARGYRLAPAQREIED